MNRRRWRRRRRRRPRARAQARRHRRCADRERQGPETVRCERLRPARLRDRARHREVSRCARRVAAHRCAAGQPVRGMRVWSESALQALCFRAAECRRAELGWIVENDLILDELWRALAGVTLYRNVEVAALDGSTLTLSDGRALRAALIVAADGADSRLRELAGIEIESWDYPQRAIVCHVATERPHEARRGNVSCRQGRSRSCRSPTVAARSCGPADRSRRAGRARRRGLPRAPRRSDPARARRDRLDHAARHFPLRCCTSREYVATTSCSSAMQRTWCIRWRGRA